MPGRQAETHEAARRRLGALVTGLVLGILLLIPSQAGAAKSCGLVDFESGNPTFTQQKVAAWKVDCSTARSVAERWLDGFLNRPITEAGYVDDWRCVPAMRAFTLCDRSKRYIWIIQDVNANVGFLEPPPPPPRPWKACGIVTGLGSPSGVALYRLKAQGVRCGKARSIGKRWRQKVFINRYCQRARCRVRGFVCLVRPNQVIETGFVVAYPVRCSRGNRSVFWRISLD